MMPPTVLVAMAILVAVCHGQSTPYPPPPVWNCPNLQGGFGVNCTSDETCCGAYSYTPLCIKNGTGKCCVFAQAATKCGYNQGCCGNGGVPGEAFCCSNSSSCCGYPDGNYYLNKCCAVGTKCCIGNFGRTSCCDDQTEYCNEDAQCAPRTALPPQPPHNTPGSVAWSTLVEGQGGSAALNEKAGFLAVVGLKTAIVGADSGKIQRSLPSASAFALFGAKRTTIALTTMQGVGAFDVHSGASLWNNTNSLFVLANSLVGTASKVLVCSSMEGSHYASVAALDAATGKLLWTFYLPYKIGFDTPATLSDDETTLYMKGSASVIAVDVATGKARWETPVKKGLDFSFNIYLRNGTVFVGAEDFYVIDAATGNIRFMVGIKAGAIAYNAKHDMVLAAGPKGLYHVHKDGGATIIDPAPYGDLPHGLVTEGDYASFASMVHTLVIVHLTSPTSCLTLPSAVTSIPKFVHAGTMLVATVKGSGLIGVDLATKKTVWTASAVDVSTVPLLESGDSSTVFVVSRDFYVSAVHI